VARSKRLATESQQLSLLKKSVTRLRINKPMKEPLILRKMTMISIVQVMKLNSLKLNKRLRSEGTNQIAMK
jgi:hypothetical protein